MSKTFEVIFKEFHESEIFVVSKTMLEDYKTKAAQEERERIIKILKKNSSELGWIQLEIDDLIKAIERKSK